MASVAKHIRRLRVAKHLTQEELAEKLFVTRQAVSAWETGKSLPDVETLERIAAALEVDVTEVIYGVPPSPNLGRLKHRWATIGGGFVIIVAVLVIILLKNGAYGTWQQGLAYQFADSNYRIAYADVPGSYSVEVDLSNLESNAGKVLYEDEEGCRILVDAVDEQRPGEYRVWFRAYGVCQREGGQLVSGCQMVPVEKLTYTLESEAKMTAAVGGRDWVCSPAGQSSLIYKDGNSFGFHLTPQLNSDQLAIAGEFSLEEVEQVTVTVSGLSRFSTQRVSYWDIY